MLDFFNLLDKIPEDQNFVDNIRNRKIYVDKTDIIYNLTRHKKCLFLSRPRRFGKSTIISILKELYTHGVKDFIDENGVKQESYFKGLAIEKLWTEEKEYKVIHLNFASLVKDKKLIQANIDEKDVKLAKNSYNLAHAIESFRLGFALQIKNHFSIYNIEVDPNIHDPTNLLSDFVKKAGIGETVLLIDEYDYPLTHPQDNLTKDEFEFFSNEVLAIMRNFYATIKNDLGEYFKKIFITGITRYKDASIFTDGNTITDISLDPTFGAIVGFTRNEIKHYFYEHLRYAVMKHYAIDEKDINDEHIEQILDKLALWYDGFCFDELNMSHVFSTISILSFLSNRFSLFKQYWYDLGGLPAILRLHVKQLAQSEAIENLLQDKIIAINDKAFLNPSSYKTMDSRVLLYQCGYITLAKAFKGSNILCKLPNFELKSALASLQNSYLFKNNELEDISCKYSISYDLSAQQIHALLSQVLLAINYHHFKYNNESSVVLVLLGYFLGEKINAYSEDANSNGRRDLRIDFDNNKTFVFEFKFNKKGSDISDDELLDNAINQIKDRAYNKIVNKKVRSFACVFNEEQRQISAFKELV